MTLSMKINGNDFQGFTSAQAARDMENAVSTFSFATTVSKKNFTGVTYPAKKGDLVEVSADGIPVMTGYVNDRKIDYDSDTHSVMIKGRSKTQDLADCTVGVIKDFEQVFFPDICKKVSSDFDISVVDEVGNIKVFEDIAEAETGQRSFKFIESLARKRQVLLTDNGLGDLVIIRASSVLSQNSLQNLVSELKFGGNNIKKGSLTDSDYQLYNEYIAQGQLSPINVSEIPASELADEVGTFTDSDIRSLRRYEFYTEETTDSFTLKDRAEWEASIRKARAFVYSSTVQGHSFNNELWVPNIQHQIDDDFADVHDQKLLKRVTYKYSIQGGSESILSFTNKDAFTLQAQLGKIKAEEF